jgi:plastin-1
MRLHSLKILGSLSKGNKQITDKEIITWSNSKVQNGKMSSFRDSSLSDSLFFLELLNNIAPGCVNDEHVIKGRLSQDEMNLNAKYAISTARKIGCTVFLTYEDIVEVKSKMIMVLCASLMSWAQTNAK